MTVKDLPSPSPNSSHILLLGFLCACVCVCVCESSQSSWVHTQAKTFIHFKIKLGIVAVAEPMSFIWGVIIANWKLLKIHSLPSPLLTIDVVYHHLWWLHLLFYILLFSLEKLPYQYIKSFLISLKVPISLLCVRQQRVLPNLEGFANLRGENAVSVQFPVVYVCLTI